MKEIKFRAWDKLNKRMVKHSKILSIGLFDRNLYFVDELFKGNPTYITEFEVMQYTGLKDKNGVEIYDGDIVTTPYRDTNSYIYYSAPSFGLKDKIGICTDFTNEDFNEFEVIGNIYENPELLEQIKCN